MRSAPSRRAALSILGLALLCAALVWYASRPPRPVPATAPATVFSAERALRHVRAIAERPHPMGSAEHARVRAYVVAELRALGLSPEVQEATAVSTRYAAAGRVRNVLARLAGRAPGGPAVLLMAHYDGVGGGPAAGDDAAGTAAVLETLRALRAGEPLRHDVIALITDGEEAGLLGAAAFVREHPWARDVGVTLNVEARGTGGRSYMFETGPGNLDAVRVLRGAGDVSATSLSVTVYRTLPNDTDLSEMALLGRPALNFAFADGVERYHTAYDDVAHLDPGSLQHHGVQMLALARAFGNGPLPRPVTGDAVFFDLPFAGLVVYSERWAMPLALVATLLVGLAAVRHGRRSGRMTRDLTLGVTGTLMTVLAGGGLVALVGTVIGRAHDAFGWGGAPAFRGVYTAAIAMLAVAVALACWAAVRQWSSAAGAHLGALIVWSVLTLVVTWKLPGVSFLFVWPLAVAALAALVAREPEPVGPASTPAHSATTTAAVWGATVVAAAVIVPVAYAVSAVLLGVTGPGGIAAGILVGLLAWVLAPQLEAVSAGRPWRAALGALGVTVLLVGAGMATVRSSPEHPTASLAAYLVDADEPGGWLVTRAGPARSGPWGAMGMDSSRAPAGDRRGGGRRRPPEWVRNLAATGGAATRIVSAPHVAPDPPTAMIIADSALEGKRRVVLRVRAAPGTESVGIRAEGARVLASSVDGRAIDRTRYRRPTRQWRLDYSAPPDSGFVLSLTVPPALGFALEVTARSAGIPPLPGVTIPPRPADVTTSQSGDLTLVRRRVVLE